MQDEASKKSAPNGAPNSSQIGGQHYRLNPAYQHWDLVVDTNMGYFEGQITKYVTRWRRKNGVQDLKKAIHYINKLISLYEDERLRIVNRLRDISTPEKLEKFYNFCSDQKLSRAEVIIFERIVFYTHVDDLKMARLYIEQLIEQSTNHLTPPNPTEGHPV